MPRVTIEVNVETRDRLHAEAEARGMSLSRYTKLLLRHASGCATCASHIKHIHKH